MQIRGVASGAATLFGSTCKQGKCLTLFWWTFVSDTLGNSALLRLLFETQTHDDCESDAGNLADQRQTDDALVREQLIQREEDEWLCFSLEHTSGGRPQNWLKVARQCKKKPQVVAGIG